MKKNRKKTEEFILKWIKEITKDEDNVNLYKEMFKKMNDKEFDEFMESLRKGDRYLQIIVPPDKKTKISIRNNLQLGKKLGIEFISRLNVKPSDKEIPPYKTPEKYLVVDLPFRRLRQTVEKGVSYSKHVKSIDLLTGQVTGDSASSKLSLPEIQLLVGMKAENVLVELLKFRGGDVAGNRALNNYLMHYGKASMNVLKAYAEGVISTKTLRKYFNGMHLKVNKVNEL